MVAWTYLARKLFKSSKNAESPLVPIFLFEILRFNLFGVMLSLGVVKGFLGLRKQF